MLENLSLKSNNIWPLLERVYDFILCFEVDTGHIIRKYGFNKVCVELDSHDNYYSLMDQYKTDYVHETSNYEFCEKTELNYLQSHDYVKFVGMENIETDTMHWYEYLIVVEDNIGIMFINDIHEAHCRILELEQISTTDYLTGTLNRRTFDKYIQDYVQGEVEFSLIFIDVDDFKMINDKYGHDKGDNVLSEIGKVLIEVMPEGSKIARYGGDEFAVIINPVVDKEKLISYLDRLDNKLRNDILCGTNVSTSIGVSNFPMNGNTLTTVLKSADKALYCAKFQGKNRYIFSE